MQNTQIYIDRAVIDSMGTTLACGELTLSAINERSAPVSVGQRLRTKYCMLRIDFAAALSWCTETSLVLKLVE